MPFKFPVICNHQWLPLPTIGLLPVDHGTRVGDFTYRCERCRGTVQKSQLVRDDVQRWCRQRSKTRDVANAA